MKNDDDYKKIETECDMCKTKFDIWITTSNYSLEVEENIRNTFYSQCPACKHLEKEKNK